MAMFVNVNVMFGVAV